MFICVYFIRQCLFNIARSSEGCRKFGRLVPNDRREEKKSRATVLPDITDHTLDAPIPRPEFVSKPVAISVSVHLSAAATGGSAFSHLTCVLLSSFFLKRLLTSIIEAF